MEGTIRRQSLVIVSIFDVISVALAILAAIFGVKALKTNLGALQTRTEELEIFASRIAHDLKNPLQAITLASSAGMRPSDLDAKNKGLYERIFATAQRMNDTIDGLFQFAKSGGKPEIGAASELGFTLDRLLLAVKPDADRGGVALEVDPFEKPLTIRCPEGVMASILSNLIRNALKYLPEGEQVNPKVSIHVKAAGDVARVEVEDNGPGVEPGKEKAIFEPYIRGTTQKPGIGLGLATVKRLAESYKGRVGVTSQWHQGSRFWVELPRVR